ARLLPLLRLRRAWRRVRLPDEGPGAHLPRGGAPGRRALRRAAARGGGRARPAPRAPRRGERGGGGVLPGRAARPRRRPGARLPARARGKTSAFGGRILPGRPASGDPPPKYLNSAESPVFRKGHTLYGLALARDAIRKADRAVVVEGYLDVIALAQAGIGEVVAPLGTALTAEQLRLLRRFTETVIACFDGDLAGRRAAARSFPVFLEAGLWGRGAFLPAGDDPDTFVRARGRAALEGLLAAAEPLVEPFLGEL